MPGIAPISPSRVRRARALRRQEAFEEEAVGRQARGDERGEHGGGAGDRGDGQAFLDRRLHEPVAGIRHERRARVRDQGQGLPFLNPVDHAFAHRIVGMLVIGDERRGDAVMGEQRLRHPCVLGQDRIGGGKHAQRAERHVLQVADGGRDHIEAGREGLGFGSEAEGGESGGPFGRLAPLGPVVDSLAHRRSLSHEGHPCKSRVVEPEILHWKQCLLFAVTLRR